MEFEKALDEYLTMLVEERFSKDIEDDVKIELKLEVKSAFQKLFNLKLMNSFSDEDFKHVEELAKQGNIDEIPKFAEEKGISTYDIMKQTMIDFAERYRSSGSKPSQEASRTGQEA